MRAQYYKGLKDLVKDELARVPRLTTLEELVKSMILIDNYMWERQLEQKGMFNTYSNYQSTLTKIDKPKKLYYRPMPIEIDTIQWQP